MPRQVPQPHPERLHPDAVGALGCDLCKVALSQAPRSVGVANS